MNSSRGFQRRYTFLSAAVAAFAVFLFGESCKAQQIHEHNDSATGRVEYFTRLRLPKLDGGSFWSERYLSLNFHTFAPPVNASVPYLLLVNANAPDWVIIEPGSSLTLTLDQSEVLPLAGSGSCGRRKRNLVLAGKLLQETALYPLSQDQLVRIGHAKTVSFRLVGRSQTITGSWKPELMADAASLAAKGPTLFGGPTSATGADHISPREQAAHVPGLGLDEIEKLIEANQLECAAGLLDAEFAQINSARVYFLRGEIARRSSPAPDAQLRALAAYEQATGFSDAPKEAYREKALLHRARAEHEAAVAAFKRYLALAPGAADAPLVHSYLQERGADSP